MEVDNKEYLVLTKEQARHLHILANSVDSLEQEEAKTHQELTLFKSCLNTFEAFFNEARSQLERFETHQELEQSRIRDFNLHKNFVLH